MEIKLGQYWLIQGGGIVLITKRSDNNTHWIVNIINTDGNYRSGIGIADKYFQQQLTIEETKEIGFNYAKRQLNTFLSG
ncbi:MAG: hypothetical protein KKC26_02275 [Nanoarchaeota archaeon]|nr:hypothetical protein [Nanoarchaeota archaeon]